MSETLTLANVLDDAAFLSLEHQLHLEEVLGEHSWKVDLQEQRFEFTGSRPLVCTRFHLLGSAAPGPRSWLWAWANPSGFPEPVTALSASLRDFGQRYGIAELTSPEVPFDALPGATGEPVMAAAVLTDAAKAVSGSWTAYNGDAGGGTRAAFLVEHPDFQLPPPEPARIMRVLSQGVSVLRLTDHRRAVHSYAQRRGLGLDSTPDYRRFTLKGPGFDATVDFDDHNRIANINATLSSPNAP